MKRTEGIIRGLLLAFFYILYITFLSPRLSAWGFHPDMWIVLVYLVAFAAGPVAGTLGGFGGGLLQDLFTSPFPFYVISKTCVGFIWGMLRSGISEPSPLFHAVAVFLTSIFQSILNILIYMVMEQSAIPIFALLPTFFKSAMATVLIAFPVFWIIRLEPRVVRNRANRSSVISSITR